MDLVDNIGEVNPDRVTLEEGMLGYDILVEGESAGAIEGVPGHLEYIEVDMHWKGKGVGRAALNAFIDLSREQGVSEVTTNNAVHPAMEHILKTEGFKEQSDDIGWMKNIS